MKYSLLNRDGDLLIDEWGDISLTDSVRQAVRIRLLWFFQEWRFAPSFGVPYFEDILVKNPNIERVRRIIRDEVLSVEEVTDTRNIRINYNPHARTAAITLDIVILGETFAEEVLVYV